TRWILTTATTLNSLTIASPIGLGQIPSSSITRVSTSCLLPSQEVIGIRKIFFTGNTLYQTNGRWRTCVHLRRCQCATHYICFNQLSCSDPSSFPPNQRK